jgi:hypothetical protein
MFLIWTNKMSKLSGKAGAMIAVCDVTRSFKVKACCGVHRYSEKRLKMYMTLYSFFVQTIVGY